MAEKSGKGVCLTLWPDDLDAELYDMTAAEAVALAEEILKAAGRKYTLKK